MARKLVAAAVGPEWDLISEWASLTLDDSTARLTLTIPGCLVIRAKFDRNRGYRALSWAGHDAPYHGCQSGPCNVWRVTRGADVTADVVGDFERLDEAVAAAAGCAKGVGDGA